MVLLAEFVPWLHVVVEQPAVIDDARDEVHVVRSEEHTSELQSQSNLVCRLLLEKKKKSNTPFLARNAVGSTLLLHCRQIAAVHYHSRPLLSFGVPLMKGHYLLHLDNLFTQPHAD